MMILFFKVANNTSKNRHQKTKNTANKFAVLDREKWLSKLKYTANKAVVIIV